MRTAKTLIRLCGYPGWSESSLGAHSFCWFCHVAAQMWCALIYPTQCCYKTNKVMVLAKIHKVSMFDIIKSLTQHRSWKLSLRLTVFLALYALFCHDTRLCLSLCMCVFKSLFNRKRFVWNNNERKFKTSSTDPSPLPSCWWDNKLTSDTLKINLRMGFMYPNILKAKSNFTAYIYTKKLLAIFLLKSWEVL